LAAWRTPRSRSGSPTGSPCNAATRRHKCPGPTSARGNRPHSSDRSAGGGGRSRS
jgi:hypothetical protein